MINLFELDINGNPQLGAEIRLIPEFAALLEKDKSKGKADSMKYFSYIYFMEDFKSPYQNIIDYQERNKKVARDFIKNDKYKQDDNIKTAILKYREFQETPSMRMLYSSRVAINQLEKFLDGVRQNPPMDAKEALDIAKLIEKVGPMTDSMNKLEDQVKKEITDKTRMKSGKTITSRED